MLFFYAPERINKYKFITSQFQGYMNAIAVVLVVYVFVCFYSYGLNCAVKMVNDNDTCEILFHKSSICLFHIN